jgi:hypothetical protein
MPPVEGAAERQVFTNPVEFGVSVAYGAATIPGVLSSEYFAAEVGALLPVEGGRYRLEVASADLPALAAHGDTITVASYVEDPSRAGSYKVREIQPDGAGMTVLVIEKQ